MAANVLRQAREALKKNQNLEQTGQTLVKESEKDDQKLATRVECLRLAAECSRKLHADENRKLYLGQKTDTSKFYAHILNMFVRARKADSLSRTPDERGRIKPLAAKRVHDFLQPYRQNLLGGGKYLYLKGKMADAYPYFDMYVSLAEMPAFAADSLLKRDTLMSQAAYLAAAAAYASGNDAGLLRHSELAQQAGMQSHLIQEYVCRTLERNGDSATQRAALTTGLERSPEHPYFFSNIVDKILAHNRPDEALAFVDSMLKLNDSIALRWYARSLVLMRMERDREAIDACDACLRLQPDHVDALYNKGIASLNLAVVYAEHACTDITDPRCLRDREIIRSLYTLAKVPMERVRQLAPQDTARWASPLYRIYLHLNMGPQFDEMDRIVNK